MRPNNAFQPTVPRRAEFASVRAFWKLALRRTRLSGRTVMPHFVSCLRSEDTWSANRKLNKIPFVYSSTFRHGGFTAM
jgi:hypothetical protein